jgi:hypothetical protein
MSAIGRNGQNQVVAAPAAMTPAEIRKAGTSPAAPATTPQVTAPTAWAPKRTVWYADKPRARTHPGRKSCNAAFTLDRKVIQATPAGSSTRTVSGRLRDTAIKTSTAA